jgi:ankyrin repeat protein
MYRSNEITEYLIEKGIDVNHQSENLWTPLHKAVILDNIEAVRLLIKSGAHMNIVNSDIHTPIDISVLTDNFNVFKLLYDNRGIISPKIKSLLKGRMKMYLLTTHIEPEPTNLVEEAVLIKHLSLEDLAPGEKYCFRYGDNNIPYFVESKENVEYFIDIKLKGSDDEYVFDMVRNKLVPIESIKYCIRRDSFIPIIEDILNNNKVKDLDEYNISNINYRDPVLKRPLISWAVKFKNFDLFKQLFDRGALLNKKDRDNKCTIIYINESKSDSFLEYVNDKLKYPLLRKR